MARMSRETRNFISSQISTNYCKEQVELGVEIVNIERFRGALDRTPKIAEKLFCPSEIKASSKTSDQVRYYAGIIAAKEALMRALGMSFFDCILSRDIEVLMRQDKWQIALAGRAREMADANEIIETPLSIAYTSDEVTSCVLAITQQARDDLKMKRESVDELTKQFKQTRCLLDDI